MNDTIVWISGATEGVGLGLARTVPYPDARIINLSRRQHPEFETVQFDLTRPETYAAVQASFERELANFKGKRAIFFHNAYYPGKKVSFVTDQDEDDYANKLQANAVAPLILGQMFLRTVKPGYESGLILMSSASARSPMPGQAAYCAAKSGVEMWVRVVKRELALRNSETWVVAVRPGFVDTPTTRSNAAEDPHNYPTASAIAKALETREGVLSPEEAGRDIWSGLPPKNNESLLLFGEMVTNRKV
jgi:NAD(P)-dependent dehydrogenase (short-subunit alcohol dehydrogenase family)